MSRSGCAVWVSGGRRVLGAAAGEEAVRDAGGMRFTEHELTTALTGAAKSVLASRRRTVRGGRDVEVAWAQLDRYQRFKLLDALGAQILPVLVALPDVDVVPGTRPSYDDEVVGRVVEGLIDDGVGRLRRAVLVKTRTAMVQVALAHLPPRLDPDALIVSDHP